MSLASSSSSSPVNPSVLAQQQQSIIDSLQAENVKLHTLGSQIQHQLKVAQDKLVAASAHRPRIPSPAHFTGESGSAADEWIDSLEKQFAYYGRRCSTMWIASSTQSCSSHRARPRRGGTRPTRSSPPLVRRSPRGRRSHRWCGIDTSPSARR